ncbi:PiggyBac transposable element-derived protein 2 [Trichinella patagoniensis]|uniref:PiggyBac transposable element-derived protein 2 n=1 Tax=Trichinella patagoniensis TaxID=990121 RepID=A0A0V0ZCE5_9BILA|nr:PiggyBac transposable element-derived protein 2 [Trichinella patagoniensis]
MDPKVENPVGFFSVNVVIKLYETLPKDKGDGIQSVATIRSNRLRSYPVMPFNELKPRRRGASDFYRTNDNKVCVVKWFDNRELDGGIEGNDKKFIDVPCPSIVKEYKQFMGGVNLTAENGWVFFWAIHVSLTNSWLKYKDDCLQNGIATRDVMDLMEFMLSVSESSIKLEKLYIKRKRGRPEAQRTAEKEPGPSRSDTTQSDQTAHWPEMVTSKKVCRVCKRTTQLRCMKCDVHLSITTQRSRFFSCKFIYIIR